MLPELLIAAATLLIVWFGVKRGLRPLARLSEEIKSRSAGDLRPIDAAGAPEETRPLVGALNGLLERGLGGEPQAAALPRQRRAPAAHAARRPAGAHRARARAAVARAGARRSSRCTRRRSAPGASPTSCSRWRAPSPAARARSPRRSTSSAWSKARPTPGCTRRWRATSTSASSSSWRRSQGDAFLLREALANLVHNSLEYSPRGARVTVRTGRRDGRAFLEVEDDGPGIAPARAEPRARALLPRAGHAGHRQRPGPRHRARDRRGPRREYAIGEGTGGRGCRVAITFPMDASQWIASTSKSCVPPKAGARRPQGRARHHRQDLGLGAAPGRRDGRDARRRPGGRLGLGRLRRGRSDRQGEGASSRRRTSPSCSPTASPTRKRRAGACLAAARCSW